MWSSSPILNLGRRENTTILNHSVWNTLLLLQAPSAILHLQSLLIYTKKSNSMLSSLPTLILGCQEAQYSFVSRIPFGSAHQIGEVVAKERNRNSVRIAARTVRVVLGRRGSAVVL
jgi:hypothetical protein